jgi:hypothetical protein
VVALEDGGRGALEPYRALSRFTNPGKLRSMLDSLPSDVIGICRFARDQTIHHNLVGYYRISSRQRASLRRVWPPTMEAILGALREMSPFQLALGRAPSQRVLGACILESHFLAGLLRSQNIAARVRVGYFQNVMTNPSVTLPFWEGVAAAKDAQPELRKSDPLRWKKDVDDFTARQFAVDHHIEHWICEYRETDLAAWRLVDANTDFLKAHSGIEVPFVLPPRYFEPAFAAWTKMRAEADFDPDQYAEEPLDGRSHIRFQMLSDFFSLLNHDVAGQDEPTPGATAFISRRKYEELSANELNELDQLADLLSTNPSVDTLRDFYRRSPTLRFEAAELDPHSLVYRAV